MHIITAEEVKKYLAMNETIEVVQKVLKSIAKNSVVLPERNIFSIEERSALALNMPAYLPEQKILGMKVSSIFPTNLVKNMPLIHAMIILMSCEDGTIESLVDGSVITAMRTGAVSAVATTLFSSKNAKNLAIIGAGAQARTQVQGVLEVRDIDRISIYSRGSKNKESFSDWINDQKWCKAKIELFDSISDCVKDADIICTATSKDGEEPLISLDMLKNGVHINAVGGRSIDACEICPKILEKSLVVVEKKSSAVAEAGEIRYAIKNKIISEEDIKEIGIYIDKHNNFCRNSQDFTVFKSVGLAAFDLAAADLVLKKFLETRADS